MDEHVQALEISARKHGRPLLVVDRDTSRLEDGKHGLGFTFGTTFGTTVSEAFGTSFEIGGTLELIGGWKHGKCLSGCLAEGCLDQVQA